jgi:hypothetical protein
VDPPEGQPYALDLAVPVAWTADESAPQAPFTATVSWGDGLQTEGARAVADLVSSGGLSGTVNVTGTHAYAAVGTYTITATVTSADARAWQATTAVQVTEVPLGAGAPVTLPAVAGEATGQVLVGRFVDANPLAKAADFAATVTWGDGNSSNTPGGVAVVSDGSDGSSSEVLAGHTYAQAGSYDYSVAVSDPGGFQVMLVGTAIVRDPGWSIVADQTGVRSDDPERALQVPVAEAGVDLNTGGLRLTQPLDFDQSSGTAVGGDPALVYNSTTVNAPRVQIELQGDPQGAVPNQIQVQLTWGDNPPQAPVTFYTAGHDPAQPYLLTVPVTAAVTSGVYSWNADLQLSFPGGGSGTVSR